MHKPTVTLGIPTCYGGESLRETVRSIRASQGAKDIKFLVYADRTPIAQNIQAELQSLNVELHWNAQEGSQLKKVKQIIASTTTDILIITQDDIIFDTKAITAIIDVFTNNPEVTMVGSRILPLPHKTWFESTMAAMVRTVDRMSSIWNNGNNYLAASGRCLSFRTAHLKQFNLPEGVVNGDMYMYLENLRLKGEFKRAEKSKVHIRCPQKLADQMGPSTRFQYSQKELQAYYSFDISPYYYIPKSAIIKAIMLETLRSPISLTGYFGVYPK